jgi:hypothetical protein
LAAANLNVVNSLARTSRVRIPDTSREHIAVGSRTSWLDTLDVTPRARIQARALRFSTGNLGDHESVGGRVWRRAIFGSGYRTIFQGGAQLVLTRRELHGRVS